MQRRLIAKLGSKAVSQAPIEEWNNGVAVQDIENAKVECLQRAMDDKTARITFPTSGFSHLILGYDGTQQTLRDVDRLSVSPELVSGKQVAAFKGCFVYRTVGQIHRTAFCFFYEAKLSDISHLNYCTVGQTANWVGRASHTRLAAVVGPSRVQPADQISGRRCMVHGRRGSKGDQSVRWHRSAHVHRTGRLRRALWSS